MNTRNRWATKLGEAGLKVHHGKSSGLFATSSALDSFQRSLSAQLQLIWLAIGGGILYVCLLGLSRFHTHAFYRSMPSIVNNSHGNPIDFQPVQALSWRNMHSIEPRQQRLLAWQADPMGDAINHRTVERLTDLVFEKFLSGSGTSMPPLGTSRTLPDGDNVDEILTHPLQATQHSMGLAPSNSKKNTILLHPALQSRPR